MKLTFVYGSWSCGSRPFDFSRLYDDPRGLTGSETSSFSFARELAARGHEVRVFAPLISAHSGYSWNGVQILPLAAWNDYRTDPSPDVVLSWNEPDQLRGVPRSVVRFVNQQLNDFGYCQPGFDDFVDVYTSPCEAHRQHMVQTWGSPSKWRILPNGCNPADYKPVDRVPGRVLYASSPDRGLHWLLQQWPIIKKAVPEANLRVFYNFDEWLKNLLPFEGPPHHPNLRECSYRAYYIREALERLRPLDVQHFKSVSRVRMAEEMSSAMVLAYPCDTVTYTEGFSATLMEACAAGLIPVTAKTDSLGWVYGDWIPTMVESPIRNHLDQWTDFVIKALRGQYDDSVHRTRELAANHSWPVLTDRLESILQEKLGEKRAA